MRSFIISKRNIVIALMLLLAAAFFYFRSGKENAGLPGGQIGIVRRQDLVQRVTISGQIWPKSRLDVKAPFNGYIAKLYVKVGMSVKKHDPLVMFSPSLSGNEASFPIRAVFDGLITQMLKSEGEYVTESGDQSLVLRLEDVSQLFLLSTVPELDIAKVKVGQEAIAKVSALPGETFKAVITEISRSARDKDRWSSSSTEFHVRLALPGADTRLMTGMSTVMDVTTDKREKTLVLGHEYIQEEAKPLEGYFVTLESGEKRIVTLGLRTDEASEILAGLNEGERVKPIDFLALPPLAK